uniref:Uncharacterized protein n=1 Tax=Zea mays TaxID=4577 RepID=A0A804PE36_MAIZE
MSKHSTAQLSTLRFVAAQLLVSGMEETSMWACEFRSELAPRPCPILLLGAGDAAHGPGLLPERELLHLPRGCLGQLGHEHHRPGRHVPRQARLAERHHLLGAHAAGRALPERHECARRLAPVLVGPPHHCGLRHGRVREQRRLHLDGADVLPAGDDDVLGPVQDPHVAVAGVPHRQVARPQPPAGHGLRRRGRVLVVPAHHRVPAEHHLAHGAPVRGHAGHRGRVLHVHLQPQVVEPLPGLDGRALRRRQRVPLGPPRAHRRWPVRLRQPVRVDHQEPELLHPEQHLRRRRRAARHHSHRPLPPRAQRRPLLRRGVHHHAQHRRRAAHVRHPVRRHGREDGARVHLAQAHVGAALRRHAPHQAPPVAVEHGHRPQVHRQRRHVVEEHRRQRVQVRAAVGVHHALGPRRRPRRVVQRDRLVLVVRPPDQELWIAASAAAEEEGLVLVAPIDAWDLVVSCRR